MRGALPHVCRVADVIARESVADAPELRDNERCRGDPDEDMRGDQVMDAQDGYALGCEQREKRGTCCGRESGVAFDASCGEREVGIVRVDHTVDHVHLLAANSPTRHAQ